MPESDRDVARQRTLDDLCCLGILERRDDGLRTSRRWQGAMARAALRLRARCEREDVRIAICEALLDSVDVELSDQLLVDYVLTLLAIEAAPFQRPPAT